MQAELRVLGADVTIAGINAEGFDSGLGTMSELGDLPLLQDTVEDDVWGSWDAGYRDVYILNGDNILVGTYNLTTYSLAVEENYETLKAMFIAASDG